MLEARANEILQHRIRRGLPSSVLVVALLTAFACGGPDDPGETLSIAGIPDQNASRLARRYDALTTYLSDALGVKVRYVSTVDYAATVIAFKQGGIQMAWFGGLTGVQARLAVPGSQAIAHRPRDAEFHSRFIVQSDLDVDSLEDLRGLTFTFGSESSTSGHLMPRYFLLEAGIDPETDFNRKPNFSGSHDKTWKLVESGAFQAGVLNEAVWEAALEEGRVDTGKVRAIVTTPPYFDYNWTVRGDADVTFGSGFTERVRQALLAMDAEDQEVLDLFSAERFEATANENYSTIEDVAKSLGIIQR